MRIFLIVVGVHAVILGFGFWFAGYVSLVAPDEQELADLKARGEIARQKGWLQAQLFSWQWQQQFRSVSRVAKHWVDRPQARTLIYVGAGFLAIAAAVGYFLNVFS